MSDQLKPCPFCGGKAELWRAHAERTAWIACMSKCSVLVSKEHKTDAEAIAAWNRREIPAAQPSPDVEPVAWRWESCANSQGWNTRYGCEKPEPSDYITDIVPLYDVQPSPDVAALVEAVDHLLHNYLLDEHDEPDLCVDDDHWSSIHDAFTALARVKGGE